jgi:hypothetical protein
MVLTGGLSNPEFEERLERIRTIAALHAGRQMTLPERTHRPMRVSDALASVLSAGGNEPIRMFALHSEAERLLKRSVPRSTIKTARATRRFERVDRGRYRVRLHPKFDQRE